MSWNLQQNADDVKSSSSSSVDTWVQCYLCGKWRRVVRDLIIPEGNFICSMNITDPQRQNCNALEEEF